MSKSLKLFVAVLFAGTLSFSAIANQGEEKAVEEMPPPSPCTNEFNYAVSVEEALPDAFDFEWIEDDGGRPELHSSVKRGWEKTVSNFLVCQMKLTH